MNFADDMKAKAEAAAQQKALAEQAESIARRNEYNDAHGRGRSDAEKHIGITRSLIEKAAKDGKFEVDVRIGETDTAHHFTSNAYTVGLYERTKQLLIQDGFSVKDKISGNGYNYDSDCNAQEYYSWYDLSVSWKKDA